MLTYIQGAILGFVEGITEFLPISSTGHLILTKYFLSLENQPFLDDFIVIIQLGCLLAVCLYYRSYLSQLVQIGLRKPGVERQWLIHGFIATLPILIVGYTFKTYITTYLFSIWSIVIALFLGGVAILLTHWHQAKHPRLEKKVEDLSFLQALGLGSIQSLALWPGISRSMSSILAGRWIGLSPAQATDFSFFLAIPALGAAIFYKLITKGALLYKIFTLGPLLLGLTVAFIIGYLVISIFLNFLRRFGLKWFGVYRILLALLLGWWQLKRL